MKKTIIVLLAMALSAGVYAKDENTAVVKSCRYSYEVYGNIPTVKNTFEEQHPLGSIITEKWNTFIANYTCVYDVEVGFSGSATEIRKPAVFKAVERADRYIRHAVRDGGMASGDAVAVMAHILDCANVICFEENTADFETAARKAKAGKDVVELFENVELKKL